MALTVSSNSSVVTYTYSSGGLFDTLTVNNIKFAIFHKPLTASDDSRDLTIATDCNCIFLAPMEAEKNIVINAVNVLVLGSLSSKSGTTIIQARNLYCMGLELEGNASIQLDNNLFLYGLQQRGGELLKIVAGGKAVLDGIPTALQEIKALFAQGITQANGMKMAEALLKTAQTLDDPEGKKAVSPMTLDKIQTLLLTDS